MTWIKPSLRSSTSVPRSPPTCTAVGTARRRRGLRCSAWARTRLQYTDAREAPPWTADELVERLRAQGARYHNLHPFHVRMDAGELTREELQRWVANRFYYQRCIPLKDAAILSNCPEIEVRREWVKRIIDHDGTSAGTGGIESWLRLGEALGVARDELESERRVLPAVRYAVDAYVNFARQQPWIEAVASSLTELFGPGAIRVRLAALEAHYPWIDPAGLEYFRDRLVQAPRDAEHALAARRRALPDARAAGARRRGAQVQDGDALGAARGDRARRHATAGRAVNRPRLVDGARLQYDDVREEHLLLIPEGAVRLNETAAQVLELCDGQRSLEEIAAALSQRYAGADVADDVRELLGGMRERGLVVDAAA